MDDPTTTYLTTGELAERLGYSVSGLKKLARMGVVAPAGTLGRNRIWRTEQVEGARKALAAAGRTGRRQMTERLS